MALSGSERQRRWRERHPEKANAHLEVLKAKKAEDKADEAAATECDHEDRGVRVKGLYCGKCRRALIFMPGVLEKAHEDWLSRPPALDDGE